MESKSHPNRSHKCISLDLSDKGQVIVEYILLLVVAVGIAALIMSKLTSRTKDQEGILVKKWQTIQSDLAKDLPDKCEGSDCSKKEP